jgi:hypothetical protein
MEWEIIDFGKFKGKNKTLPQILFNDPDWFFWQYNLKDGFLKKRYNQEAGLFKILCQHLVVPKIVS